MGREESPMSVKRIVTNIATEQVGSAHAFYCGVLGMSVAMDLGWILTFAADGAAAPCRPLLRSSFITGQSHDGIGAHGYVAASPQVGDQARASTGVSTCSRSASAI
jgi:hypothetical protein